MKTNITVDDLVSFENRVAKAFNAGKILAPVHLYAGNEVQILKVFQRIAAEDWVFCSWRSHYQCLLKGVPEEELFKEILAGRSIFFRNRRWCIAYRYWCCDVNQAPRKAKPGALFCW